MNFLGYSRQKGFTIVELLIVIVVIAILAAIMVVAFRGIQTRGRVSARNTEVANDIRLLELYKVDKGDYPGVPWVVAGGTDQRFCIGTNFPNGNKCTDENSGYVSASATDVTDKLALFGTPPSQHFSTDTGKVGPLVKMWGTGWGFTFIVWSEGSSAADCPTQIPNLWWNDPNSNTILCAQNFNFQSKLGA